MWQIMRFLSHQGREHVLVHSQNFDFVKEHNRTPLNSLTTAIHLVTVQYEIRLLFQNALPLLAAFSNRRGRLKYAFLTISTTYYNIVE